MFNRRVRYSHSQISRPMRSCKHLLRGISTYPTSKAHASALLRRCETASGAPVKGKAQGSIERQDCLGEDGGCRRRGKDLALNRKEGIFEQGRCSCWDANAHETRALVQRKTTKSRAGALVLLGRRLSAARRNTALSKKGRSLEREPWFCRDGGCRRRGAAPSSGKREDISSGSVVLAGSGANSKESKAPAQRKTEGSFGRERWLRRGGGFRRRRGPPP